MGSRAEKQAAREKAAHVKSKIAFQGKFISVQSDEVSFPDGSHATWDKVVHPGAVVVIPFDDKGDLVMIEQWRRTIGQITLELPAGLIDPGESIEECAQRELQEEIGQKASKMEYLGWYYSSPGILSEKIHFFVAKELTPSQLYCNDTDKIDIRTVPFDSALKLVKNGTIVNGVTALGILLIGHP